MCLTLFFSYHWNNLLPEGRATTAGIAVVLYKT